MCYNLYNPRTGIGFTAARFTVVEGESLELSITIETNDGMPLSVNTDVTLGISDDVEDGSTPLQLTRLMGDTLSTNGVGDLVVTFTVPVGTNSGESVSFTGLSVMDNDVMENTDLEFVLSIEGFDFTQISGFGFATVVVEDDDDGK